MNNSNNEFVPSLSLPFKKIDIKITGSLDDFIKITLEHLKETSIMLNCINNKPYCSGNCTCIMNEEFSIIFYITPMHEYFASNEYTFIFTLGKIEEITIERLIILYFKLKKHNRLTLHICHNNLFCENPIDENSNKDIF